MNSSRIIRESAFTLIELIVVMAIVVTLSVIGFISYNSYIKDSRNAARTSHLNEISMALERFVFENGRAPWCVGYEGLKAVCYLTPVGSPVGTAPVPDPAKSTAVMAPFGFYPSLPWDGVNRIGVISSDWSKMIFKRNPEDPRGVYYLYATDGRSKYMVFATREEPNGYSLMVRGSKAVPVGSPASTDVIASYMTFDATTTVPSPFTVQGWRITNGAFDTTAADPLLYDGNTVAPYRW